MASFVSRKGASPMLSSCAIKLFASVAISERTQIRVSCASSQFRRKSVMLLAKAPMVSKTPCSPARQNLLKLYLSDSEIPINDRDSAVRTGRNETRFVLPEVKLQSRPSSDSKITLQESHHAGRP